MADVFSKRCGCGAVFALCSLRDKSTQCVGCQRKVAAGLNAARPVVEEPERPRSGEWHIPSHIVNGPVIVRADRPAPRMVGEPKSADACADEAARWIADVTKRSNEAYERLAAEMFKGSSDHGADPRLAWMPEPSGEQSFFGGDKAASGADKTAWTVHTNTITPIGLPIQVEPNCPPGSVYFMPRTSALEQTLRRVAGLSCVVLTDAGIRWRG